MYRNSSLFSIFNLLHSRFIPLGKTVGTPWQKASLRAISAKGINTDNVHVMCINDR